MVFIEEIKAGQLIPHKVREEIAFIPLEAFFDNLDCIKEDAIWWSFEMKNLVSKIPRNICI